MERPTLHFFFFFFGVIVQDRVSLYNSSGSPGTFFIVQASLKLAEICLPLLPSVRIKGVATTAQGRSTFNLNILRRKYLPLMWIITFAGSLYKEHEKKEPSPSLLAFPLSFWQIYSSQVLEPSSLGFLCIIFMYKTSWDIFPHGLKNCWILGASPCRRRPLIGSQLPA